MLRGLDALAWGTLDHAYGPGDDLPEVIRAAASTDEEQARAAVDELFGSVFHQGTVYPASVAVVPFVAELAVTPTVHHRFLLVYLLGGMADPREAYGAAVDAVRAAVTAQVPRLLPLLADPDRRVRETVAYTLAQCPDAAGPVAARLRQRWAVEDAPLVRASLLAAGGRLDPAGWAERLSEAVGEAHATVRAAAALTLAWAGLPWPSRATAAVISAYRDGDPLAGWVWTSGDDSLPELLQRFDDVTVVPATVLRALVHATKAETRRGAVYAVQALNLTRRSAPARLLPLLAPLLTDADQAVREAAVRTVRISGSAGMLVAEELAALAAQCADGDETDRWEPAAEALCALIQLGDLRWRAPLLAAWRSGWAPVEAGMLLREAGAAFDPELLAAVCGRLASLQRSSIPANDQRAGLIPKLDAPIPASNERAGLVWLLGAWGAAAAPAIPELIVALDHRHGGGAASRALVAIGPAAAAALPALRAAAGRGDVDAAVAVWRLAGEPDPLIGAVERAMARDTFCAPAIARLLELGGHAQPLLPRLKGWFLTGEPARTSPDRDAQIAAAQVVWRLTGDPDAVVPTVRAVLAAGGQPAGAAARLAAELGAHAQPLLPPLRAALDDRWARVDAAGALWRLGGAAAELVDPLVVAVAECMGGGEVAVDLLVEMRATGAVARLRELADQDARIVTAGILDDLVRHDERLQARLLQATQHLQA